MEMIVALAVLAFIFWKVSKIKRKRDIENSIKGFMQDNLRMMEEKRIKIEAQGIPYIHPDRNQGVFQMVDFPYATFEEWDAVYRKAAAESNPALAATTDKDGKSISLIDFLDDEPCRRAYAHHLNPEILGKKFGEIFNPPKY